MQPAAVGAAGALPLLLLLLCVCLLGFSQHVAAAGPPPLCQQIIEESSPLLRGPSTRQLRGGGTAKCKYPVDNFVVLGERNSGTNFISQLIKENVKPDSVNYLHEFPKHWSLADYDSLLPKRTLFILAIRNPYDWLFSMHHNCYCCEKMTQGSFSDFLKRQYTVDKAKEGANCPASEGFGPTGSPIPDMMVLRSQKLHMHLHLGMAMRPYFLAVRLEDLWCRPNPAAYLQERLGDFCFDWKEDLVHKMDADSREWLGAKFNLQEKFDYSWYFNPAAACKNHGATTIKTIHKGLHTKLERRMGYKLLQCD